MGRNSKKLNFLIEEGLCREMESLIPAGKRSIVINNALRKELEIIRRKRAVEKILTMSPGGKRFSNQKILESLAKEREGH